MGHDMVRPEMGLKDATSESRTGIENAMEGAGRDSKEGIAAAGYDIAADLAGPIKGIGEVAGISRANVGVFLTLEIFFLLDGDAVPGESFLQAGCVKFCGVLGSSNLISIGGDKLLDIHWDSCEFFLWLGVSPSS
jgi:hypothetical protein